MERALPRDVEMDRMNEQDPGESNRTSPRPGAPKARTAYSAFPVPAAKAVGAVTAMQGWKGAQGHSVAVCECVGDSMFREVMASVGMCVCALALLALIGYVGWRQFRARQDRRQATDSQFAPGDGTPLLRPDPGPDEWTGSMPDGMEDVGYTGAPQSTTPAAERVAVGTKYKARLVVKGDYEPPPPSDAVYVIHGAGERKAHFNKECYQLRGKASFVKHELCKSCKRFRPTDDWKLGPRDESSPEAHRAWLEAYNAMMSFDAYLYEQEVRHKLNKDLYTYKVPLGQAQRARELLEAELEGTVPNSFIRLAQFFVKPRSELLTREQAEVEWNRLPETWNEAEFRNTGVCLAKCSFCQEDPPDHVGAQCPRKRGAILRSRPALYQSVSGWKCSKCRLLVGPCSCE